MGLHLLTDTRGAVSVGPARACKGFPHLITLLLLEGEWKQRLSYIQLRLCETEIRGAQLRLLCPSAVLATWAMLLYGHFGSVTAAELSPKRAACLSFPLLFAWAWRHWLCWGVLKPNVSVLH